jgi:hypothetical protein
MYLLKDSIEPRRRLFRYYDAEQHEAACYLAGDSGAALKVFEAVMHRARLTRSRQAKLTSDLCRQFAIDRKAKKRGLTLWSSWGVFSVEQSKGKNPVVHLAAVPGRIVRHGRLRRVQIARLDGPSDASFVEFNDGTEARAGRSTDRSELVRAEAKADFVDAELVDRGTGWLVWRLLPASDQWRPLEEVVC